MVLLVSKRSFVIIFVSLLINSYCLIMLYYSFSVALLCLQLLLLVLLFNLSFQFRLESNLRNLPISYDFLCRKLVCLFQYFACVCPATFFLRSVLRLTCFILFNCGVKSITIFHLFSTICLLA